MTRIEKLTAIATAAAVVAAIGFVSLFLLTEIRYALHGKSTTGSVTSVTEEFARFANGDVDGMKPIYRYHCTYSFTADGATHDGDLTTEAKGYGTHAPLKIQYITGAPSQHRVLTPTVQVFRVVLYGSLAALAVMGAVAIARVCRATGMAASATGRLI